MRPCYICDTFSNQVVYTLYLQLVNDIPLSNKLSVYGCERCNFYYSNSHSTQIDYDVYYTKFNNYQNYNSCLNKDERCFAFLNDFFQKHNITSLIDYGSGNGDLAKFLSSHFEVDRYDIGMQENIKQYDCLILSHVLEHIYSFDSFIDTISNNIKNDGYLYIEVPNAEFYKEFNDSCPLQELNIEHINFFSKFALNKLLIKKGFTSITVIDDYFILNNTKYYVIRGIFQKKGTNRSFLEYIDNGSRIISSYNYASLTKYPKIYVYGCGQFLFKLFDHIQEYTIIINVVDDNICYTDKHICNVGIISHKMLCDKIEENDVILITTLVYSNKIKEKIKNSIYKPVTVLDISEL